MDEDYLKTKIVFLHLYSLLIFLKLINTNLKTNRRSELRIRMFPSFIQKFTYDLPQIFILYKVSYSLLAF